MWVFLLFLSLLVVVFYCVVEIFVFEVFFLLYYYISYDFDFEVEGWNRIIVRVCKGFGIDNKCNFNEFVNYVFIGEFLIELKYFEVINFFFFYFGDVGVIIDQFWILVKGDFIQFEFMIKLVKIVVGMIKSLGRIVDRNYKVVKEKKKDIECVKVNMKVVFSGMVYYVKVKVEIGMFDVVKVVKNL